MMSDSRMRWILLFSLTLTAAAAEDVSNPPPPAPPVSGQRQESHPAQAHSDATADPQAAESAPALLNSIEAQKTPERTEQERPERYDESSNERRLVTWTVVLDVATIFLALIAAGQLFMFWKQLALMRGGADDTRSLAIAAQASAQAAKAQADALVTSDRAWVSIVGTESNEFSNSIIDASGEKKNGIRFTMRWINSGRTPALNCKLSYQHRIVGIDESVSAFEPLPDAGQGQAPLILPGMTVTSYPWYVSDSDIQRCVERTHKLFMYSRAEYQDIFLRNTTRVTEVFLEGRFDGVRSDTGAKAFAFTPVVGAQNSAT
jgi:hypothetical protein